LEVHYTTWHPETIVDYTLAGLKFARTPVFKEREAMLVSNQEFVIPAGHPRYQVNATHTLQEDITVYSAAPHMHQFGTDFEVDAELPTGEKICMMDVEYDFKHQGTYIYKRPLRLPAGTKLNHRAFYDNSENNPRQLNHPPIDIPFGRTSDKEMCQLTVGFTRDKQQLTPSSPAISSVRVSHDVLIVSGSDLRDGAFIEIDGKLLHDTRLSGSTSHVFSFDEWREACPEDVRVSLVVINPDGGRSAPRSFVRRSDVRPGSRFRR
jgi:hypothetical protein